MPRAAASRGTRARSSVIVLCVSTRACQSPRASVEEQRTSTSAESGSPSTIRYEVRFESSISVRASTSRRWPPTSHSNSISCAPVSASKLWRAARAARLEHVDLQRRRPLGRPELWRLGLVVVRRSQRQEHGAVVQGERDRLGRGPGPGPVGVRDRRPAGGARRGWPGRSHRGARARRSVAPARAASVRAWLSRWVRLRSPRVRSSDAPSGATAHRRTAISAFGRSAESSSSTSGKPRISSRSSSGGKVKVSERSSSARWSAGQSPEPPSGHQAPASAPRRLDAPVAQREAALEPPGLRLDRAATATPARSPSAPGAPCSGPRAPPRPASRPAAAAPP